MGTQVALSPLFGGLCLLLSQSASLLVNFFDRGSSMYRLNSEQMAQRSAKKKIPEIRAALEGHRMTAMQRTMIGLSLDMAFVEVQIEAIDSKIA